MCRRAAASPLLSELVEIAKSIIDEIEIALVRNRHRHDSDAARGQHREGRARGTGGREDVLLHVVVIVLAGYDLDNAAEDHEAHVVVIPFRPRLERLRLPL